MKLKLLGVRLLEPGEMAQYEYGTTFVSGDEAEGYVATPNSLSYSRREHERES